MGRRLNHLLVTITWRKLKQTTKVLIQLGPVTRSESLRTIFCYHPDSFCNIHMTFLWCQFFQSIRWLLRYILPADVQGCLGGHSIIVVQHFEFFRGSQDHKIYLGLLIRKSFCISGVADSFVVQLLFCGVPNSNQLSSGPDPK